MPHDRGAAYIGEAEKQAVLEVLESRALFRYGHADSRHMSEQFEAKLRAQVGVDYAVGVSSGTAALRVGLAALDVGPGDEVIVPAVTFIASPNAVIAQGAVPVFAEVDESFSLDPASLAERIGPRTKAIMPVHLYGRTVDLGPILSLARDQNIAVIEDACQAHGARLDDGSVAGSAGRASAFSFYCSKNLGAYGEAGSITTNDDALATELRSLREHGQSTRYYHPVVGYNARLDEIQAAILRIKLRRLPAWNARRVEIARRYNAALEASGVTVPEIPAGGRHVFHLYVVRVPGGRRDALKAFLGERGIGTGVHYPVPIHLQEAAAFLGYRQGDLPVTERLAGEILSLPMFAEMTDAQVDTTAAAVTEFMRA